MDKVHTISVERHILQNERMYFGAEGANPQAIASFIVNEALRAGATRVMVSNSEGWWYVCADTVWAGPPVLPGERSDSTLEFSAYVPENAAGGRQSEVIARVFSSGMFVVSSGEIIPVCGQIPLLADIEQRLESLGKWSRISAFAFSPAPGMSKLVRRQVTESGFV